MVSKSSFDGLSYQSSDAEYLKDALSLVDPNNDGTLTLAEYRGKKLTRFRDFYENKLNSTERRILSDFNTDHPLSRQSMHTVPEMALVLQKHLRYKMESRLKEQALPFDQPVTLPPRPPHPASDFTTLRLDMRQLKRSLNPNDWQLLTKNELSQAEKQRFPSPTIHLLREFIRRNGASSLLRIAETHWENTFQKLEQASPQDFLTATAASTWNELMLIWESSDESRDNTLGRKFWRRFLGEVDNSRLGTDWDLAFLPTQIYLGASGLSRYLKQPSLFHVPVTKPPQQSPNLLQQAQMQGHITWPNHPTRITLKNLGDMAGVHLDVQEKARAVVAQNVQYGNLGFTLGQPLLWLEGFDINVDAGKNTRWLAKILDFFTSLFGKNFDVESIQAKALTVYNNRLCLAVRGETNNRDDLVKPIFKDLVLIDITELLLDWLQKQPRSQKLISVFFNASGNLHASVPTGDLTQALLDFFKGKTFSSGGFPVPLKDFKNEFWVQDIEFQSQNKNFQIQNGKLHASGHWPDNLVVRGTANLKASIKSLNSTTSVSGAIEFHLDSHKKSGFARLNLTTLAGRDFNNTTGAKILAQIHFDPADLFGTGQIDAAKVFNKAVESLLLEINNPDGPWLTLLVQDPKITTYPDFSANADLDFLYRGALSEFLQGAGKIKITQTAPGEWLIRPDLNQLDAARHSEALTLDNVSGSIKIKQQSSGFDVGFDNFELTVVDAQAHVGNTILRGKMHATLNGSWTMAKATLPEKTLSAQTPWQGSGTLTLHQTGSELSILQPGTSSAATLSQALQTTTIQIGNILFPGGPASGSLSQKIESGTLSINTGPIQLSTELSGSLTAQGNIPRLVFTAPATPTPDLISNPETTTATPSDMPPREFIDNLLAPVIARVIETPNTPSNFDFYLSHDFPLEAMLGSLHAATLSMGAIPLAESGYYERKPNGQEVTQIPFFKGAAAFLNPKIQKGTQASMTTPQNIVVEEHLQDFVIDINPPIRFLGRQIKGIGLARCALPGTDPARKHFYLLTPSGKIDVLGFLRLAFPCKIAEIYRRLKQDGIRARRNEVPSEVHEFGRFVRHFIDVFEFERKVREKKAMLKLAFTADEFSHMTPLQKGQALAFIRATSLAKNMPRSAESLHTYLNQLASRMDLAEFFQQNLDQFSPDTTTEASELIEDILYTKFVSDKTSLLPENQNLILAANRHLLRLYLKPYIRTTQWLDMKSMHDIDAKLELQPRQGDYAILAFKKDGDSPVATRLRLNPTQHENFPNTPVPSGFYLDTAMRGDETLNHAFFNLKTDSFWVRGDFNSVRNLHYYLGPKNNIGENDFSISFDEANVDNLDIVHMQPNRLGRPKFTLFSPEEKKKGHFNHAEGRHFSLAYLNDTYHYNFNLNRVSGGSSFLYLLLGESGKERDMLISLDGADLQDFNFDTKLIPDLSLGGYSGSVNNISGKIDLSDGPSSTSRAILYLGDSPKGEREYLVVDELTARGDFTMEGESIRVAASMHLKADLPEHLRTFDPVKKLKDKGVELNFKSISIDGDLVLKLNENGGGIERLALQPGMAFEPTRITLHGQFKLATAGVNLTLSEITLPLSEMSFEMQKRISSDTPDITNTWLSRLLIPANEIGQAGLNLSFKLPDSMGGNPFKIKNGQLAISTRSPLEFLADSPKNAKVNTDGLSIQIADESAANTLQLQTGKVKITQTGAQVDTWQLSATVKDLIWDTVIQVLLEGKNLNLTVKEPQNAI